MLTVLVATVVTIFGVFPFYHQLKETQDEILRTSVSSRARAVNEFLERMFSVATQITSRTEARKLLGELGGAAPGGSRPQTVHKARPAPQTDGQQGHHQGLH